MMTHPLTDEMMRKIHGNRPGYSNPFDEDDMRAAADWQLEQVIAWLDNSDPFYSICDDPQETAQRLKKAMRPHLLED
jgi:hypothetical protein